MGTGRWGNSSSGPSGGLACGSCWDIVGRSSDLPVLPPIACSDGHATQDFFSSHQCQSCVRASANFHPVCVLSSVVERVICIPRIAAVGVNGINVNDCVWPRGDSEDVPRRGGILLLVTKVCAFVVGNYSARLAGRLVQVQFLTTVILLRWPNSQTACVRTRSSQVSWALGMALTVRES